MVRDAQLVTVQRSTQLRAGDDVVVLAEPELHERLVAEFTHLPAEDRRSWRESRCTSTPLTRVLILAQ